MNKLQRQLLAAARRRLANVDVPRSEHEDRVLISLLSKQLSHALTLLHRVGNTDPCAHNLSIMRDAECVCVAEDLELQRTYDEVFSFLGVRHPVNIDKIIDDALRDAADPPESAQ